MICKHTNTRHDAGNLWCGDCGCALGAIFKIENYLEDEENE